MLTRRQVIASTGSLLLVGTRPLAAQISDRPIRILVGYPAGGGVDLVARLLVEPIKAALGQPVVVENRTGASAMIAAGAVANIRP